MKRVKQRMRKTKMKKIRKSGEGGKRRKRRGRRKKTRRRRRRSEKKKKKKRKNGEKKQNKTRPIGMRTMKRTKLTLDVVVVGQRASDGAGDDATECVSSPHPRDDVLKK